MHNALIRNAERNVVLIAAIAMLATASIAAGQSRLAQTSESSSSTQNIPTPDTESIFGSFRLDRLGGEKVTIWDDKHKGNRYYYLPSLLPEWSKFHTNLNEKCASHQGNNYTTVNLRIYLSDEYYEAEIRAKIADKTGKKSLNEHMLSALPHDNIQIVLKKTSALPSRLVYDARDRSHMTGVGDIQRTPLLSYPREIETPIAGSCNALKELANMALQGEDLVDGRLYFQGVVYKTTSFAIQLNKYLNSERRIELFGDESLVKRVSYTNTLGFSDDKSGKNLLLNLPTIVSSGSGKASRQRLLSRNYFDYVNRVSSTSIFGGCVEASPKSDRCAKLQHRFMEFLISHAKNVEVTFQKLPNSSFELVSKQIAYATLTPQQHQAIARGAPSFEGKVDGEAIKSSGDGIVWDFSGTEPIPTKAKLLLLDEQALRSAADVYWYEKIPVEEGSGRFVADLSYFPLRIADKKIIPLEEHREREKLKCSCQQGGRIVRLQDSNVWPSAGNNRGVANDFRSIKHYRESSRCSITFEGGWQASAEYFFLRERDQEPVSVINKWTGRSFNFETDVKPHLLNVPDADGNDQMIEAITYSGYSSRGHRLIGKWPCGAKIQFNLQQYPVSCALFLVRGYSQVHGGVVGTSCVSVE